jgi:hypothetical protein
MWTFRNPHFAHNLFSRVGKYTRGRARVEALTIAGINAYVSHQGSLAQAALKAAKHTADLMDPPCESDLLEMVADAYFAGVHPDEFRKHFTYEETTHDDGR